MPPPKLLWSGRPPNVLVPLLIAAVGGAGILIMLLMGKAQQVNQLTEQVRQGEGKIAQLESLNQTLTQQIDSLEGDLKDRDERVTSLRTQLSSLTADLERSQTSLEEVKERAERLGEERSQLQVQVASLTSQRDEAKERLQRFENENSELERAVVRLRERLSLLDRDYRQLADKLAEVEARPNSSLSVVSSIGPSSNGSFASGSREKPPSPSSIPGTVELPPIIVRKDQAGISLPVRARVLEVNESHNFVVVDKGSMDGVRVGMVFDILRGSGSVGRAAVVRVRPQLSACDVLRSNTPGPLQAGDVAVQTGP